MGKHQRRALPSERSTKLRRSKTKAKPKAIPSRKTKKSSNGRTSSVQRKNSTRKRKAKNKSKAPTHEFGTQYWKQNFGNPEEMDGVGNAKQHANYLYALMRLEDMHKVESIAEFGFGLGYLLHECIKKFKPRRVLGIEPSAYAFDRVSHNRKIFRAVPPAGNAPKIKLLCTDLRSWCTEQNLARARGEQDDNKTAFDLGICTSVFQYLSDKDVREQDDNKNAFDLGICTSAFQYLSDKDVRMTSAALSKQVRYMYFTVPTDIEYEIQWDELKFRDARAHSTRTRAYYMRALSPHWTVVSSRLLESKYFFDHKSTRFNEQMFRF